MASESNHVPGIDHFHQGMNMNQGSRGGLEGTQDGTILAEFIRRERSGTFTASGAGDTTVTFSEQMQTDNVNVQLTSDTVAAVPIIKNGTTPDKTGFVVTVAAASVIHWVARDMGPTS